MTGNYVVRDVIGKVVSRKLRHHHHAATPPIHQSTMVQWLKVEALCT
jgi:hypothetical protein